MLCIAVMEIEPSGIQKPQPQGYPNVVLPPTYPRYDGVDRKCHYVKCFLKYAAILRFILKSTNPDVHYTGAVKSS